MYVHVAFETEKSLYYNVTVSLSKTRLTFTSIDRRLHKNFTWSEAAEVELSVRFDCLAKKLGGGSKSFAFYHRSLSF